LFGELKAAAKVERDANAAAKVAKRVTMIGDAQMDLLIYSLRMSSFFCFVYQIYEFVINRCD
jgi:hypothetical protein